MAEGACKDLTEDFSGEDRTEDELPEEEGDRDHSSTNIRSVLGLDRPGHVKIDRIVGWRGDFFNEGTEGKKKKCIKNGVNALRSHFLVIRSKTSHIASIWGGGIGERI